MPSTDFFDDDLIRQREGAKRIKMGPADEPAASAGEPGSTETPSRPVSEINLTRMARHKQAVDNQAAAALQELERLRKRQEQLEYEKRELEELRRKHSDFDRGKREMIDHLRRSLATLERHEVEAQRMIELLAASRKKFKMMLGEIEGINEEGWPEDKIRDELNRSLGIIEEARMEYNKAIARIEAVRQEEVKTTSSDQSPVLFEEGPHHMEQEKPFSYWIKVGLAVSLPIVITLVILAIVFILAQSRGLL